MMKAMWGQWIRQPISASVIRNSFIGKLVCLEGFWWNWSSWIHCAVEQFLGNSPNIKSKSFHTRKSPTVTSWGWRCCAKFLSHFGLFLCPWALLFLAWMSSEKSSSTLATGIAGESRLFKHKEVKSWLMPPHVEAMVFHYCSSDGQTYMLIIVGHRILVSNASCHMLKFAGHRPAKWNMHCANLCGVIQHFSLWHACMSVNNHF